MKGVYEDIIYQECMSQNGFATLIRENKVDKARFNRLVNSIVKLTELTKEEEQLNKLTVACLFELPFEVENTINHYNTQDELLGKEVSTMAEKLREIINDFLWAGLGSYYEDL